MTNPAHTFDQVTTPTGDFPCERTPNPHIVIAALAQDAEGRSAFGGWTIIHVPTGHYLPVPTPHDEDVDTLRWIATQLAESPIDWAAPVAEFAQDARNLMRTLIAQADKQDQDRTPLGEIPASTMRDICATNARILADRQEADQ